MQSSLGYKSPLQFERERDSNSIKAANNNPVNDQPTTANPLN
jgi:hypothetical protein